MPESKYRGRMNIDKGIYDLFSKAIYHTLKKGKALTYTEIVEGIEECFKLQKTKFNGSVSWDALIIKHDMHARGILEVFTKKGKKLHRIKK